MSEPKSVFDVYFGKAKWPAVVIVAIIAAALLAGYIVTNNNTSHLKGQIVQACASAADPVTCAGNLAKAVNAVH